MTRTGPITGTSRTPPSACRTHHQPPRPPDTLPTVEVTDSIDASDVLRALQRSTMAADNQLFYGDNLEVLRHYIDDESVDLIYLDPPFQSAQDYNVLFEEKDGTAAPAQIQAFEDTWEWDAASHRAFDNVVSEGGDVAEAMLAFRKFLGETDMLAYLSMLAPRLKELRRVLKETGSIYLHCDPTASHYLKMLMDAVFGPDKFRSEIIWKRTYAHSDTKQGRKIHGHIHDVILFYTKSDDWTWNPVYQPYDEEYLESEYRHQTDEGRYYKETDLTANRPGGDTEYEWHVKRPEDDPDARWEPDFDEEYKNPKDGWEYKAVTPYSGRYWAYSKENMRKFWDEGRMIHRRTGMPRLMQFADEMPGVPLQDIWTDINPISAKAKERLGYPTQKPQALLERIIRSSSNEGDVVLDPFCGCGTTITAAQALDRQWIGIDITHLAVNLMKHRLADTFGAGIESEYEVHGEPETLGAAEQLAKEDPHEFEFWALGLVDARPDEKSRGGDAGIDGKLRFKDPESGSWKEILLQVKAGSTGPKHVRELHGTINQEPDAEIGVLITMQDHTKGMKKAATSADFYESPWRKHPRIQLFTVEELLEGRTTIDSPPLGQVGGTYKTAPKHEKQKSEQNELQLE